MLRQHPDGAITSKWASLSAGDRSKRRPPFIVHGGQSSGQTENDIGRVFGYRAHNLAIDTVSAPKQTDTTQRWKVGFRQSERPSPLHTKIEFSRRDAVGDSQLEAINSHLIEHYRLSPTLARHYLLPAALSQKVDALADWAAPQVRDVCDLSILLSRAGADIPRRPDAAADIQAAISRTLALSYDEYVGQVVAYLHPDDAAAFNSPEAWEAMQLQVVARLERMQL